MTRLKSTDIDTISNTIKQYDEELKIKTGADLLSIAKNAAHIGQESDNLNNKNAAVVPITAGLGIISGFSEAVVSILNHIGVNSFKTNAPDVTGLAEAYKKDIDLVFIADDNKFVAINLKTRHVVDNSEVTGRAYVAALELASGRIAGCSVLVIGVGNVGSAAVKELLNRGAKALLYDIDKEKIKRLKKIYKDKIEIIDSLQEAIHRTKLIFLSAPSKNIIKGSMVTKETIISAPAIPLGLTEKALKKISHKNLIHDPLQLGVAAMALEALKKET